MRPLLVVLLFASACTPVDSFVGTYGVTVSGNDMRTAPNTQNDPVSGTGTLAITANKDHTGYRLTFGQDGYLCALTAKKSATTPTELEIADMQTCVISTFTAVTTSGTVKMDEATMTTATLNVGYTFSGTVFTIAVAGTGTRTYTGARQ